MFCLSHSQSLPHVVCATTPCLVPCPYSPAKSTLFAPCCTQIIACSNQTSAVMLHTGKRVIVYVIVSRPWSCAMPSYVLRAVLQHVAGCGHVVACGGGKCPEPPSLHVCSFVKPTRAPCVSSSVSHCHAPTSLSRSYVVVVMSQVVKAAACESPAIGPG